VLALAAKSASPWPCLVRYSSKVMSVAYTGRNIMQSLFYMGPHYMITPRVGN
jgi:hypothetical protein